MNTAKISSIIPIKTDITASTPFKTEDILPKENNEDTASVTAKTNLHKKSSAKMGKKITAQAITPYIPTEALSVPIAAVTVVSASDSAGPATGTAEPIINFAVRTLSPSAEAPRAVCILIIPINRVDVRDIIQKLSFLIPSAMPEFDITGETEDATVIAKYPPIKGITIKFAIKLTP